MTRNFFFSFFRNNSKLLLIININNTVPLNCIVIIIIIINLIKGLWPFRVRHFEFWNFKLKFVFGDLKTRSEQSESKNFFRKSSAIFGPAFRVLELRFQIRIKRPQKPKCTKFRLNEKMFKSHQPFWYCHFEF